MDCKTCTKNEYISRHTHEADLDRADRNSKRWFVAWLITFVMLVAGIIFFVWYESQWEVVESTEITQRTNDGDNNYVGRDYYGIVPESQNNPQETEENWRE